MSIKKIRIKTFLILTETIALAALIFAIHMNNSVHEVCPFAAVCVGPLIIKTGKLIFLPAVISGLVLIILSLVYRWIFCYLICPIGMIQKVFSYLGQMLFKRKFNPGCNWQKSLLVVKLCLTIGLLIAIFVTAKMLTADYCPIYLIATFREIPIATGAVAVLLFIIISSLFTDRFFCKFLCPYSGIIAIGMMILTKLSWKKQIVRDEASCIKCRLCDKKCPMQINISGTKTPHAALCLNCGKCIKICPQNKKKLLTLHRRKI